MSPSRSEAKDQKARSVVSKNIGDKSMKKFILSWLLAIAMLMSDSAAEAQQAGKFFRIGYLDPSTASGSAVHVDTFRQELNKLG